MPFVTLRGDSLYFEVHGGGEETIVFSHGLLMSCRMFDEQVRRLSDEYRCVVFDHRGQGRSAGTDAPMVDMETLYDDAANLIEALHLGPVHWVGLSMGGFVGLRLASRRPELVRSLTLIATAADIEPPNNLPKYRVLNTIARFGRPSWVSSSIQKLMFGKSFLNDPERKADRALWLERLQGLDSSIYKAVNGILYRPAVTAEARRITAPALVIHGTEDLAISRSRAESLAALVNADLVLIEDCGHSASIESPEEVGEAIRAFIRGLVGTKK